MAEVRQAIQERFPKFNVLSEPDPSCRVCGGEGVVKTKSAIIPERPCLCVCLSTDPGEGDVRGELASSLQSTMKRLRKEMLG